MRTTKPVVALVLALAGAPAVQRAALAQEPSGAEERPFEEAASAARRKLEESLAELTRLRLEIAEEKLPLSRRLAEAEARLSAVREEFQRTSRDLDSRSVELVRLTGDLDSRQGQVTYLSDLLGEYVRNFATRIHVAEVQRYEKSLEAAELAPENGALSKRDAFEAQAALLSVSIDRLFELFGGVRFEGTAVDRDRLVTPGTFFLLGPAALFRSADGLDVGTVEQRIDSQAPNVIPFESPLHAEAAARVVTGGGTTMPFDPTLGNAHKVEAIDETLLAHVGKGGPVMYPILALAGIALIVALWKWVSLTFVPRPSRKGVDALLHAVSRSDRAAAISSARRLRGPGGRMLTAGVEHLDEPRELIEEVMYEHVLSTRLSLQRFLPFVAITASSAPLLGLLGTVTGIMNTFTLMTVFGTGDVKTLSSGISEALITTEFGLYVAIPSLLLYAFLSRKAKSVIDRMEQSAVAFLNQVARTQNRSALRAADAEPEPALLAGRGRWE